MKASNLVAIIGTILVLSSCKKSDDVSVSDRAEALLGQWEYQAIVTDSAVDINGDGEFNIDLFNTQEIRQCIKDNLTFFTERGIGEKGSYSINENGLACEQGQEYSSIEDDRYEWVNNNTIRFENRNEMRIVEFTTNKLVIDTDDNLGGANVIVTFTFKRS